MKITPFEWMPLDNAGKVFPGQNTNRWSNVFRLSLKLKEPVEPAFLEKALENTLERLPSFKVRMKSGFFWNYYERNEMPCPVRRDIKNPCYRINFRENNGYLFRVYYLGASVSIDFYHALCDGYGGAVFLSTLAGEYLCLKGKTAAVGGLALNTAEEPRPQETEDAYIRYAAEDTKSDLFETPAFHVRGTKMPLHECNCTAVKMSFSELHAVSKGYGVTVTELLAAVLLDIHYRRQRSPKSLCRDVSVQIPLNLRKSFPSETVRNFVLCLTVKLNPRKGDYSFDEIVQTVSEQLRRANNVRSLNAYITRTVKIGTEKIKLLPLAVKNTVIRVGFFFGAEYSTTALLSNLGPAVLSDEMSGHIEDFSFYTGPGLVNGARCGAVSFGDTFVFTFSSCYKESDIEREFMARLAAMGVALTVETNRDTDFSDIEGVTVGDTEAYSREVFIPTKKDRVKLKKAEISTAERMKRIFHL